MGFTQDPSECIVARIWYVCACSEFGTRLISALVNTDQTSGMEKSIRDHQAQNLPLGRFAEVRRNIGFMFSFA